MVMVSMLVMGSWLLVGQVAAQSEDCESLTDNLGQVELASMSDTGALAAYACALEVDPTNAVARVARLQTALLGGDYLTANGDVFLLNDGSFRKLDTAIVTQTEILAEYPDNLNSFQMRALLHLFSGQANLAHTEAGNILKLEPDSAFAYLVRAASSEMLGDKEGAVDAFAAAVDLSPYNAQFYGQIPAASTEDIMNDLHY